MKIAKIVSSNSHVAYVGRVLEGRDGELLPSTDDSVFGRFVKIPGEGAAVVGIISDSRLVDPEYQNYSSRTPSMLAIGEPQRSPGDETMAFIGILLLGTLGAEGPGSQEMPRRTVGLGQFVFTMDNDEISRFHIDTRGTIQLRYLPDLLANAGSLGVPLAKAAIETVSSGCAEADRRRLAVLREALSWRHTFGGLKV